MSEQRDASTIETPIDQHPLFRAAQEQLAQGDEDQAIINLNLLAELYPQEQVIGNLLLQRKLRSAFASTEPIPVEHSKPVPVLRQILLTLLTITFVFMAVALFLTAYNRIVYPARESSQQDAFIRWLHQDGEQRLEAGDWDGARKVFDELLAQVPGEPTAQAALELITQQEMWDQLYVDAVSAMQRAEWQAALDLLVQIQTHNSEYRDVQRLIETVQTQQSLEASFQEAQALLQAGDWAGAIVLLKQVRSQDPDFRRADVENLLFQSHVQLAMPAISQANGNADILREASSHLKEALTLQPMNRDLLEEYRLASSFVAGADAYAREDWVGAVSNWEPVYDTRPDYQGGILGDWLRQAYPQASSFLLAQANGDLSRLRQAIGYLDRVLFLSPGDTEMIEERRLAMEYVTGAEAFGKEDWNGAILHWGPIYADHPDYQEGILEENLRRACLNNGTSSGALCPP